MASSGSNSGSGGRKPGGSGSRSGSGRGRSGGGRSFGSDRSGGRSGGGNYRSKHGDDRRGGQSRGAGNSRPGSESRGSGKPKRIPAPPDLTGRPEPRAEGEEDEFRIERVDGSKDSRKGKQRTRKKRARVYVDDVEMRGIAPATAKKLRNRLSEAATAFEAERFSEAERLLLSIQRLAPDVPEVHELLGLTWYRLGRWRKAIGELERFHDLTRSVDQHPVRADCHRAMREWTRAEQLWLELGAASPTPDVIEEGRIVQAGTLADRNRVGDAIRFLEKAPKVKGKPGIHHLRRWYATADLYERAGDNSRARRLFTDIATADPDFGDAAERASHL